MKWWSSLSPFTRALAVVVVVSSMGTTYVKRHAKPLRKAVVEERERHLELQARLHRNREWVDELRNEVNAAQRWAAYADILDQQTTGQSVHDLLQTCKSTDGPDVSVDQVRFESKPGNDRFRHLGLSFNVSGSYPELVRLLHVLDSAFPPVELQSITMEVDSEQRKGTEVSASVKGIIHEPR